VLGLLGLAGVLAAGGFAALLLLLELPQPAAATAAALTTSARYRVQNLLIVASGVNPARAGSSHRASVGEH
jgi:hypothetical protein